MDINFYTKGLTSEEEKKIQDYVQKKLSSFSKLLTHFDIDAVRLDVNCQRFIKNNAYGVEIILTLPKKVIVGREASHSINKAIDLAKDRAIKQLKKHEKQWQRYDKEAGSFLQHFERTHDEIEFEAKKEKQDMLYENLRPLLGRLKYFVGRELSRYRALRQVSPEKEENSILDDVIAEYYENFQANPRIADLEEWLYAVALQKMQEAVRDYQNESRTHVSLEKKIGLDARMSSYFQPDEVEDIQEVVFSEDFKTPEKLIERRELLGFLSDNLEKIPAVQREAFVLFTLEKLPVETIAKIQKRQNLEVKNDIEQVKNVLSSRIHEEYGEATG